MHLHKRFYFVIFVFLIGCSTATQQPATIPSPTLRNPVVLPPTWTPTSTVHPSETPSRPPTLTFTPFPSVTPLPATLTSSPTSDAPTLTSTPTVTPTVDTSCSVFALEEGVAIQSAPFIDPYRLLPTMVTTETYQATSTHSTFYELTLDNQPVGWVNYGLRTIASQGPGCNQLPVDPRELRDFPSLCFFVADGEVQTYTDRALTDPYQVITPTVPYVLLLKYSDVFYTAMSEAGPSFFVDAGQVSTFGNCDHVPTAGLTIANGWLWSQPDGDLGEQLALLEVRTRLYIQQGPIQGNKPPSASEDGAWYLALVSPAEDGVFGWIWSSIIIFD